MGGACLFDMRADPTEHFNVAMQEPELVKTLKVGDLDCDAAISECAFLYPCICCHSIFFLGSLEQPLGTILLLEQ